MNSSGILVGRGGSLSGRSFNFCAMETLPCELLHAVLAHVWRDKHAAMYETRAVSRRWYRVTTIYARKLDLRRRYDASSADAWARFRAHLNTMADFPFLPSIHITLVYAGGADYAYLLGGGEWTLRERATLRALGSVNSRIAPRGASVGTVGTSSDVGLFIDRLFGDTARLDLATVAYRGRVDARVLGARHARYTFERVCESLDHALALSHARSVSCAGGSEAWISVLPPSVERDGFARELVDALRACELGKAREFIERYGSGAVTRRYSYGRIVDLLLNTSIQPEPASVLAFLIDHSYPIEGAKGADLATTLLYSNQMAWFECLLARRAALHEREDEHELFLAACSYVRHALVTRFFASAYVNVDGRTRSLNYGTPLVEVCVGVREEGSACASESALRIVKFLLDNGADPNMAASGDEGTPLYALTLGGTPEQTIEDVARLLVERGASVCARDAHGYTPLHGAMSASDEFGLLYVSFLPAAHADYDMPTLDGTTLLHEAALEDNVEMVELLLAWGADPRATTRRGETPLRLRTHGRRGTPVSYVGPSDRTCALLEAALASTV